MLLLYFGARCLARDATREISRRIIDTACERDAETFFRCKKKFHSSSISRTMCVYVYIYTYIHIYISVRPSI